MHKYILTPAEVYFIQSGLKTRDEVYAFKSRPDYDVKYGRVLKDGRYYNIEEYDIEFGGIHKNIFNEKLDENLENLDKLIDNFLNS